MGLLLARLSELARDTRRQDGLCQALYDDLSGVKGRMDAEAPADVLREILEARRASLKRAAAAGQNDREKQTLAQAEINRLEEYGKLLAGMPEAENDAQFASLKGAFSRETGLRETLADGTGGAFDNVFAFLEQAVGQSQELVLFVTEITAGFDTSWFVEEFGCEAYFRHNKELLFDERRQQILDKITGSRPALDGETET